MIMTQQEKLEKVARAIFSANTGTEHYEQHHPAFEHERDYWEVLAKAAIEADCSPTPVSSSVGIIAAFERTYPELYWHVAKGKITAGEPLYGAIITMIGGTEIGHGESDISADEALRIAVDDAGLTLPPVPITSARAAALEEAAKVAEREGQAVDDDGHPGETWIAGIIASSIRALAAKDSPSSSSGLSQDVVNLVIAAREFWGVNNDLSEESGALDKALEAFANRVPFDDQPDDEADLSNTAIHDDQCATLKGYPCNCAMAALSTTTEGSADA